jgi:hypothetical protein
VHKFKESFDHDLFLRITQPPQDEQLGQLVQPNDTQRNKGDATVGGSEARIK